METPKVTDDDILSKFLSAEMYKGYLPRILKLPAEAKKKVINGTIEVAKIEDIKDLEGDGIFEIIISKFQQLSPIIAQFRETEFEFLCRFWDKNYDLDSISQKDPEELKLLLAKNSLEFKDPENEKMFCSFIAVIKFLPKRRLMKAMAALFASFDAELIQRYVKELEEGTNDMKRGGGVTTKFIIDASALGVRALVTFAECWYLYKNSHFFKWDIPKLSAKCDDLLRNGGRFLNEEDKKVFLDEVKALKETTDSAKSKARIMNGLLILDTVLTVVNAGLEVWNCLESLERIKGMRKELGEINKTLDGIEKELKAITVPNLLTEFSELNAALAIGYLYQLNDIHMRLKGICVILKARMTEAENMNKSATLKAIESGLSACLGVIKAVALHDAGAIPVIAASVSTLANVVTMAMEISLTEGAKQIIKEITATQERADTLLADCNGKMQKLVQGIRELKKYSDGTKQ